MPKTSKPKEPKRFRLSRSQYWVDPKFPYCTMTTAPDPTYATKIVEVTSIDELVAEARKLGDEFDGASEVLMKCLAPRNFQKCPWLIKCHEDKVCAPPDRTAADVHS